jgi:hypothetical protein
MKRITFAAAVVVVIVAGGVALATYRQSRVPAADAPAGESEADAQQWVSSGPIPDFSSGGLTWRQDNPGPSNTHFLKVPGDAGPGPIVQHPDYPLDELTNRIADTSNPILQPWVKERMDREVARVIAGGLPFVPTSRCWPGGVPGLHLYPDPVWYLQTPEQVWLISMRGELRRIYMNVPHSANPGYSWYGESVGRYENGDTLVIDTIGLDDKGPIDRYTTPHTRMLHVVERHTMNADRTRMNVTITVEDPGAFTMPWQAMIEYGRGSERGRQDVPAQWWEYVCNENSTEYFIPDGELVPVPNATRRDF